MKDVRKKHANTVHKHIYMEFRKMAMMTLYAIEQKSQRCIEESFGLLGEGEGRMIGEKSIEPCILFYVNQITIPGLMHETRCSGLVHLDDPEAWEGEGGPRGDSGWGTHGHPGLIHVNVWQKPLQYCNVISLKSK